MLTTKIKIEYSALSAAIAQGRFGKEVKAGMRVGMERLAKDVESSLVKAIDGIGLTMDGDVRQQAFAEVSGSGIEFGSSAAHAQWVVSGTKPHWAPVAPLIRYADKKLGLSGEEAKSVGYAIQQKIARVGTRAQDFMTPARKYAARRAAPVMRASLRERLNALGA